MSDEHNNSEQTRDLLARVRQGDRKAFDELFAHFQGYLHRVIELRLDPRLRARLDPSDVVQETQIEAFQRLEAYLADGTMPFRLWLRQLAWDRIQKLRRFHLDTARRAVSREIHLPEKSSFALAEQILAAGPSPSQAADRRDLMRRLEEGLERLGEQDREVLLLRAFEGLSYEEVGYLLGIEPAAARQRHARAIVRLHRVLFDSDNVETSP